jgi:hypothetical protein
MLHRVESGAACCEVPWMRKYKLLVMTKPVEGREQEYNDWYQNVHLPDVVAIDGYRSAQRYRLLRPMVPGADKFPYLAIYEIETDDIDGAVRALTERAGGERMVISGAMSRDIFAAVFEELGPPVRSSG